MQVVACWQAFQQSLLGCWWTSCMLLATWKQRSLAKCFQGQQLVRTSSYNFEDLRPHSCCSMR